MTRAPVRLVVYTGGFRPDHPARDAKLVQELKSRGFDVTFCVGGPGISDTPHPREVVDDPRLAAVDARWVNGSFEMLRLLKDADLFVTGVWAKRNSYLVEMAHSLGVATMQHENVPRLDLRYLAAEWACVQGPVFKEQRVAKGQFPENRIFVTGSTMLDDAVAPEVLGVDRAAFCAKYKIDPSNRIAIWLPTAPQTQNAWHQEHYKKTVEALANTPGFSVIIKGHPNDYLKRKSQALAAGKTTWEVLAPWATVVEPEDSYQSYQVCEVGLSNLSGVSMEFPLFKKPFIYVDVRESPLHQQFGSRRWFGAELPVPSFVGVECGVDELGEVLAEGRYKIEDESRYDEHVRKYFLANDGQAYKRVADAVESVIERTPSRSKGPWLVNSGAYLAGRAYKRVSAKLGRR